MTSKTKELEIDFERDLKSLIKIEEDNKQDGKITLDYIQYLKEHLKLYQRGRQESRKELIEEFEDLIIKERLTNFKEGYNKALEEFENKIDLTFVSMNDYLDLILSDDFNKDDLLNCIHEYGDELKQQLQEIKNNQETKFATQGNIVLDKKLNATDSSPDTKLKEKR